MTNAVETLYTIHDIAAILCVKPDDVRSWIRRGFLVAQSETMQYRMLSALVTEEALDAFIARCYYIPPQAQ